MTDRDGAAPPQLKFRVPERLRAQLEEAARARDVSLAREITERLERSFERPRHVINAGAAVKRTSEILGDIVTLQAQIRVLLGADALPESVRDMVVNTLLLSSTCLTKVADSLAALQPPSNQE